MNDDSAGKRQLGKLMSWVVDLSQVANLWVSVAVLVASAVLLYFVMVDHKMARLPTAAEVTNVKANATAFLKLLGAAGSLLLAALAGGVVGLRTASSEVQRLRLESDQRKARCGLLEEKLAIQSTEPILRQDFELVTAKYRFKFLETWPLTMDYEMELTLRALQDGLDTFTDQLQWSGNNNGKPMIIETRSDEHSVLEQYDADMWHHFTIRLGKTLAKDEEETIVLGTVLEDSACSFQPFSAKCFDRLVGTLVLRNEFPASLWPRRVEARVYPYFLAPKPQKHHAQRTNKVFSNPAIGLTGEMLRIRPAEHSIEWEVPNPTVGRRYALHWDWDLSVLCGDSGDAVS